jgi:peroxiredoxin
MQYLPNNRLLGMVIAGIFIGIGVGIVILASLGLIVSPEILGRGSGLLPQVVDPQVGKIAPNFNLDNLDGKEIELLNGSQQPTLINFWATWCPPCVAEMATIQQYFIDSGRSFRVLAVNADEPAEDVQRFANEHGLSFDILLDPGGHVQELYRLRGYPTSFILDGDGVIMREHVGLLTESKLRDYLSEAGVAQ